MLGISLNGINQIEIANKEIERRRKKVLLRYTSRLENLMMMSYGTWSEIIFVYRWMKINKEMNPFHEHLNNFESKRLAEAQPTHSHYQNEYISLIFNQSGHEKSILYAQLLVCKFSSLFFFTLSILHLHQVTTYPF